MRYCEYQQALFDINLINQCICIFTWIPWLLITEYKSSGATLCGTESPSFITSDSHHHLRSFVLLILMGNRIHILIIAIYPPPAIARSWVGCHFHLKLVSLFNLVFRSLVKHCGSRTATQQKCDGCN